MKQTFDVSKTISCKHCKTQQTIEFNFDDWNDWNNGKLIQNAFPYLNPDEREMLKTAICGTCWNPMR